MMEESIKKELRRRQSRPPVLCHCGRGYILVADQGTRMCAECYAEGPRAFFDLIEGRITYAQFYGVLARTRAPR